MPRRALSLLTVLTVVLLVACGNSEEVPEESETPYLFRERLVVFEPENDRIVARYNFVEETYELEVQVAWRDEDGGVGVDMVQAEREGDTNVLAVSVRPVEGRRYTFNALFRNGEHILDSLRKYWDESPDSRDLDGNRRLSEGEQEDRTRRFLNYAHPRRGSDSPLTLGDDAPVDSVVDDLAPIAIIDQDLGPGLRIAEGRLVPLPPEASPTSPFITTARWKLTVADQPLVHADLSVRIQEGEDIRTVSPRSDAAGVVSLPIGLNTDTRYVIEIVEVAGRTYETEDVDEKSRQRLTAFILGLPSESADPTATAPAPGPTPSPVPTSTPASHTGTCTEDRFDRGEIEVVNAWATVTGDAENGWEITYGWELEGVQHPTSGSTPTLEGIIFNYRAAGPDPFMFKGEAWDYVIDAPNFERVTYVQTPGEYVFSVVDFDQAGSYCGDGDLIVVEIE